MILNSEEAYAKIATKQATYTLEQLHAELAGKILENKKEAHRLAEAMRYVERRAARGWLGWSQQELAKRASVGLTTVKDFENGSRKPIANNLNAFMLSEARAS